MGEMTGEMMGEITGEINEVQNPRTPFVQGISRISMGEMRDFFAKHAKKSAMQNENSACLCIFSLDVAKGEFVGTKLRVCYRQTPSLVPTNLAEGKGRIFMQITE